MNNECETCKYNTGFECNAGPEDRCPVDQITVAKYCEMSGDIQVSIDIAHAYAPITLVSKLMSWGVRAGEKPALQLDWEEVESLHAILGAVIAQKPEEIES